MEINSVFDRSRVISAAASMFLLISVVSSPMYPKTANADGLFQEELSASFGGKNGRSNNKDDAPSSYNRNLTKPKSKTNHPI